MFWATAASAQQSKRIILSGRDMTLSELFGEIKRQAGMTVIFDAGDLQSGQKISLPSREGSVAELLDQALPKTRYVRQMVSSYIIVRTLPAKPTSTQDDFEQDVLDYTGRNIPEPEVEIVVHYDTVRTEKPHSGIFDYPARVFVPTVTGFSTDIRFERGTPPVLAAKTNLVWWAAGGTINAGAEIGLGKRTSLELSGGFNRWNVEGSEENNKKLAHWMVKPEFRYWLCERFNGHFFGVHAFYAQYNVGGWNIPLLFKKDRRYQGDAYVLGINYGYHLALAGRWGVEFTAGVGVARLDYVQSECRKCGIETGSFTKTWFGPTELGVKMVFLIM